LLVLPSGKQLRVDSSGQGPALVFLHGLGGTSSFYTSVVDVGSFKTDYQVVLVDIDGHGQSPFSGSITQQSLVDDVIGVLDALSLDKATVIGHSFSGVSLL
jgi:3-oxoadipate enol-lactonase